MPSSSIGVPTKTTCPYCGVGCGVVATARTDGTVEITGDPLHPANFGRLCVKGAALADTLSLDDRLLHPIVEGERRSWDVALDLVAARFQAAIAEHGPDSVAFYVSGQLLTEDYYVANKLMKGFIGSANIDTNSRLCMASSVAGHKRAFGSDTVPGNYEDLEQADLVVLTGSNLAWCHPVLFQRLAEAREKRGTKIVVIDPRRTATCEIADLHLALAPGSDVALFNGLFTNLLGANATSRSFIGKHTTGFSEATRAAQSMSLKDIARATGLSQARLFEFYHLFASTERVVTVYSQGVNQSSSGTDKVNAIINCHLATGRIGKPGMGPFSVTGQPNAMGGRETGGLANMLAAHMDIDNAGHRRIVKSFWKSPAIAVKPGLKAVDLFKAVGEGRIKALWIMATNPVDSMPDADAVRAALETCPFVVVSDVIRHTDTTAVADVLLPSTAWAEKNGTVTNSERRISRQRAFLDEPGETRPDWWQMAQVAKRLGFGDAFAWTAPHEIFAEYAALTGEENAGSRDLDISAHADMSAGNYAAMAPFQWPQPSGAAAQDTRFFADGAFYTSDQRARFVPTIWRKPQSVPCATFPLVLNSGRSRDQWHTMTRTGKAPRLMRHATEPYVEINPQDARANGLASAALAVVRGQQGAVIARVKITDAQAPGQLFMPIHWTDRTAGNARIDRLLLANVDPVSGQPELKYTPVSIEPFAAGWYGFAVTRERPQGMSDGGPKLGTTALGATEFGATEYWALGPVAGGWQIELAGSTAHDWDAFARRLFGVETSATSSTALEFLAYGDSVAGHHRIAAFADDRLIGAIFVSRNPISIARDWLAARLDTPLDPAERFRLLAGRPGGAMKPRGAIVCACCDVGRNEITDAVTTGCRSVQAVGDKTRAGTNCGSCRPEIARLIADLSVAEVA